MICTALCGKIKRKKDSHIFNKLKASRGDGKDMSKGVRFRSISIFFIFTLVIEMFVGINFKASETGAKEVIPKVGIVSLDHSPFKEGDNNSFFISTKEFSGQVQYQLFYTCKTTMGNNWELINNSSTINGWTKSVDAKVPVEFDISGLNLKSDSYRFAIRVRRVGVKGKYSNQYGDYDSAYPFNLNVVKNADIDLSGDMLLDKTLYSQNESIKIEGVKGTSDNAKYKLHIYDVNNNKWMTNLTEYNNSINYDINYLPAGYYILDIWGKSEGSNKVYDGWKLKTMEVKKDEIPEIGIVSLDHTPFIEGDKNEFYITSKDYNGQVQYQLFYTNKATMGTQWKVINNEDTVDGWTKAVDSKEPITFDISGLNLKAEAYRFAIRVRRVGVKGRYSNQYGDYDCAYPFNLNVVKSGTVKLNGDMLIDKTNYAKNDNLVINGVKDAASNVQYKLHLYDVKNNKWLTELTGYSSKIDYDLSNIPEGVYIVDIWGKNSNSSSKYEGWKLKTINIGSEVKTITNVDNITTEAFRGNSYTLPKTLLATFEDGTKANKTVIWNNVADTSKAGVYNFEGTVKGYDKKVQLNLTVKEGRGNTSGNIINLGMVAEKDGWIYYINNYDEGKLYKAKPDGSYPTKISEDSPIYINIVGEWLYYCNLSDEGKLYKMKLDGFSRTKISNDFAEQITVNGDWIYYSSALEDYKLYKIKTDGTGRTKLNNDISLNLNLENGYIYYTNMSDNNNIYKIKVDGTGRVKVNNDISGFINVVGDWIYYSNLSDSYKIYKININGTGRVKVSNESAMYINVQNGWIYYSKLNEQGLLSRMKVDGTNNRIINVYGADFISVINDHVYYGVEENELQIFKVKITGEDNEGFGLGIKDPYYREVRLEKGDYYSLPNPVEVKMIDGSNKFFDVTWNKTYVDTSKAGVYEYVGTVKGHYEKALIKVNIIEVMGFEIEAETETISKVRPKGSNLTLPYFGYKVYSDGSKKSVPITWNPSIPNTSQVGEFTYEGSIPNYNKKVKLNLSVVNSDNVVTGEIVYEDNEWIYFKDECDKYKLYKIRKDGTEKTKVIDTDVYVQIIKEGWIYYLDSSKLYKIKTDGTNKVQMVNENIENLKVIEEYIYYVNYSTKTLSRINMYSNQYQKLTNDKIQYFFTVDKDWIYYSNGSDGSKLYKIKMDGTNRTKLNDQMTYEINIIDSYIYYSTRDSKNIGSFFKIKTDGSDKQALSSNSLASQLKVIGEWIYFVENTDPGSHASPVSKSRISKLKIGTSQIIPVTSIIDNQVTIMDIKDNWITYYNYSDGYEKIYKIKIDGTENTKIVSLNGFMYIRDGWVYYRNYQDDGLIYKMRLDATENQIVA